MKKRFDIPTTVRIGACLVLLLGLTMPLAAAPVLDQAYDDIGGTNFTGGIAGYQWQQGVTAGLGGLLTSVELNFASTGTTRVYVNLGAPWQTDADDFSAAVAVPAVGWTSVDVSNAGIFLAPGDEFSLGFEGFGSSSTAPTVTGHQGNGTYAGGALFYNGSGFTNGSLTSDINFRTYVDTAVVVPLPAAAYLLVSCLAGLVPLARRKVPPRA